MEDARNFREKPALSCSQHPTGEHPRTSGGQKRLLCHGPTQPRDSSPSYSFQNRAVIPPCDVSSAVSHVPQVPAPERLFPSPAPAAVTACFSCSPAHQHSSPQPPPKLLRYDSSSLQTAAPSQTAAPQVAGWELQEPLGMGSGKRVPAAAAPFSGTGKAPGPSAPLNP